jgi:hypothetical protein
METLIYFDGFWFRGRFFYLPEENEKLRRFPHALSAWENGTLGLI